MVEFLTKLSEEIYLTEAKVSKSPPNKKVARLLAQIEDQDYALYLIYSKHTYWLPDLSDGTAAAVEPHSDGDHMIFHYDPSAWEEYDYGTILFLLLHELGHIIREHHSRASQHVKDAKYYHKVMNISMDTWINEDIVQGKLGQYKYTPKPPYRSFSEKTHGDLYGSTVEWLERQIEGSTGTKPDLEYKGPRSSEALYDWILKTLDENGMLDPPDEDEDKEIKEPEIGDIIKGPDGRFGEVLDKDPTTKQVTEIEILTKEEAYRRVREKAGMEIPESLRKRSSDFLRESILNENTDVNWDFSDITILKSSLGQTGGEGGDQGGEKPPKTNEEDIDQSNEGGESSDGDSSGDSDGGSKDDGEIKIGDIVQDMNTGKYGRVTAIDGGDLYMDPVSDEELKKAGFKSAKMDDETVDVSSSDINWGSGLERYS